MLILILNFVVESMDYGKLSAALSFTFSACGTRSCVNVDIVDDLVDEPEEFSHVTLGRTSGLDRRITLDPVDGRIEIIDDDGKYTVLINY